MEKNIQDRLAYWLLKDMNKAIREFNMIQDRDRIAVAVSGGKDSLSLLRLLDVRRASSREKYSLFVIHIIGDARGPVGLENTNLSDWLAANCYEYALEPMIIPDDETLPMTCQRCTWNRRRTIFEVAHKNGCNKIAFGHHADDLAQTTLLNLIYSGKIETMAPKVAYFDGEFQIIRPMCYLSEKAIRRFARALNFPPSPMDCRQKEHSHRQRVEEIIHEAEKWCKNIRTNLLRAGLKGIDSP
jgi:tRNA 2-thiocytidine biosynthesis protein TtcA